MTTSVYAVMAAKSRVNTPLVINTPPVRGAAETRNERRVALLAEIVTRTRREAVTDLAAMTI